MIENLPDELPSFFTGHTPGDKSQWDNIQDIVKIVFPLDSKQPEI